MKDNVNKISKSLNKKIAVKSLTRNWKRWRFKNTFLLITSLVVFFYLAQTPYVSNIIKLSGNLGYFGSFIAGMFFVSTFTFAPSSVILFQLADRLNPIEVSLLAGLGAMTGDYLIFRFMKDKVFDELLPIVKKIGIRRLNVLYRSPYFAWAFPILGALIIASPLPDEVGVSMMGISKISKWKFLLITFILNAAGIFLVVAIARA